MYSCVWSSSTAHPADSLLPTLFRTCFLAACILRVMPYTNRQPACLLFQTKHPLPSLLPPPVLWPLPALPCSLPKPSRRPSAPPLCHLCGHKGCKVLVKLPRMTQETAECCCRCRRLRSPPPPSLAACQSRREGHQDLPTVPQRSH